MDSAEIFGDAFVVVAAKTMCGLVGLSLLAVGYLNLRRLRLAHDAAKRDFERRTESQQRASASTRGPVLPDQPIGTVGRAIMLLGLGILVLPVSGVFDVSFDRFVYKLFNRDTYIAPRSLAGGRAAPFGPQNLSAARSYYETTLVKKIAAPQECDTSLTAPDGAELITYPSGALNLKAWVSADPVDGEQRPAVVYLHSGFALTKADWVSIESFRDAGFVVMTPSLRGENGNPGNFEFFYGEVDDVIAAGRYVASLSYVDSERVYAVGHRVGGQLCIMAVQGFSVFRAGVSIAPTSLDTATWIEDIMQRPVDETEDLHRRELVVFDPEVTKEVAFRNPNEFIEQIQVPLLIYVDADKATALDSIMRRARQARRPLLTQIHNFQDDASELSTCFDETIPWLRFLNLVEPRGMWAQNIQDYWANQSTDAFEVAESFPPTYERLNVTAFKRIEIGMSKERVLQLMGPSGHVGDEERSPKLREAVNQLTRQDETAVESTRTCEIWTSDTQVLVVEFDEDENVGDMRSRPDVSLQPPTGLER